MVLKSVSLDQPKCTLYCIVSNESGVVKNCGFQCFLSLYSELKPKLLYDNNM